VFVSSSAAQFLVNGLELVGLAEGDELHDLIRQPHLRGGSGFYGIARIPITTDKNFFILSASSFLCIKIQNMLIIITCFS